MNRVCVNSFFYYNELFCVVGKKLKRYFYVSLKSVLFLSLFPATVTILGNRVVVDILCEKTRAEK